MAEAGSCGASPLDGTQSHCTAWTGLRTSLQNLHPCYPDISAPQATLFSGKRFKQSCIDIGIWERNLQRSPDRSGKRWSRGRLLQMKVLQIVLQRSFRRSSECCRVFVSDNKYLKGRILTERKYIAMFRKYRSHFLAEAMIIISSDYVYFFEALRLEKGNNMSIRNSRRL